MIVIVLNALLMALETNHDLKMKNLFFFTIADKFFMAVYTLEFLMKFYVEPVDYWKNGYNVFDAVILIVTFIPVFTEGHNVSSLEYIPIIRALRSLRVLKTISFFHGLQTLIEAMFLSVKSAAFVLQMMLVLMFIFSLIGFYIFGDPETGDPEHWGDLGSAFFTIFSLVTVDGWTDIQDVLDDLGMRSSRVFTVVFVFFANFVLFNAFVGTGIREMHNALMKCDSEVQSEREALVAHKKQAIVEQQMKEMKELIQSQTGHDTNFSAMVESFKRNLQHTDYMLTEDLCTSVSFTDLYLTSLDYQDDTLYKLLELYKEAVYVLSDMLEQDLIDQKLKEPERKLKIKQQLKHVPTQRVPEGSDSQT
ncbi:cation channel sperm-associated protein 3-like [Chanos chanos]|uniref:Cation channel sperm-associated protein 3-like n=1 Tax=Chanos chanos TaxID=29144 RepID=A0A6J2WQ04_CHACN|nr:cation channel sperm-associated protein 3-like [Chanos chanos]